MMRVMIGATILLLAGAAQAQTPPSNMAAPSGNTGAANNGTGTAGGLLKPGGSHSSMVASSAELGDKTSRPTPPPAAAAPSDPKLEKDPTQGAAASPSPQGSAPSPK